MDVVEDDNERALAGQRLEEPPDRPEDLLGPARRLGEPDRSRDPLAHQLAVDAAYLTGQSGSGVVAPDLVHDLGERPVRDAFPVGEAAADNRACPPLRRREELPDESRLPDSGCARDRDQAAGTLAFRLVEPGDQGRELLRPADEGSVEAAGEGGRAREHLQEAKRADRPRLPLQLERPERLCPHRIPDQRKGRLPDDGLARCGGLLKPRGDIHGVPRGEGLPLSGVAGHDVAGVDAVRRAITTPSSRSSASLSAAIRSCSSLAARTALRASSSRSVGMPKTAITASPMNFSTVPPWRSSAIAASSNQRPIT